MEEAQGPKMIYIDIKKKTLEKSQQTFCAHLGQQEVKVLSGLLGPDSPACRC